MVTIRQAEKKDLPQLRKIAIETCIHTFGAFNSDANMEFFLRETYGEKVLEDEWNQPGTGYFLAWDGSTLVGFSRIRTNEEARQHLGANTLELQRLYIHADHQGKKIGSLLIQHAIDYCKGQGHEWLWLGVWERNFKAQEFYAKWGFERFSQHVFPMGDDPQTDWLLKKKID